MEDEIFAIQHLLEGALLEGVEWNAEDEVLKLFFDCNLNSLDESKINDTKVEVHLLGVDRFAVYYFPIDISRKPSELNYYSTKTLGDIEALHQLPINILFTIDSPHEEFVMQNAYATDWLVGNSYPDEPEFIDDCLRIHIPLLNTMEIPVFTNLFISCQTIKPWLGGKPLSIDDWWQQAEAATCFPDEEEERPEDIFYRPPNKPAFEVISTNAPDELLQPLKDFHGGLIDQDWERMAWAYPNFNFSSIEHMEQIKEHYYGDGFGQWVYVRQIDSWWIEKNRAYVSLRGIAHRIPSEDCQVTNLETTLEYTLLQYEGRWIISNERQDWIYFDSDDEIEIKEDWKFGWNLDE